MEKFNSQTITLKNGEVTHYYEGGSPDGTPLIFIHGWPDIAETWIHQFNHFSSSGKYRVIAPDMRGYGNSSAPTADKRSYSLEVLATELVDFAAQLSIKQAVWVAHDWGCGVVNALAGHYPELFLAMVNIAVPYRTIELGLNHLKTLVNRDLYPEDEYEWGQFDYMRYYELHPEASIKMFEEKDHIERITKALYAKSNPAKHGERSFSSTIIRDGGWFGGNAKNCPDIPLAYTSLDEHHLANLVKSHKKNGFFGPTAYYLNSDVNAEYTKSAKNNGVLEFPVLYIDAKHDGICSPSTSSKMAELQRQTCKDLKYETVESGHWAQMEKPDQVNEIIAKWLGDKI